MRYGGPRPGRSRWGEGNFFFSFFPLFSGFLSQRGAASSFEEAAHLQARRQCPAVLFAAKIRKWDTSETAPLKTCVCQNLRVYV